MWFLRKWLSKVVPALLVFFPVFHGYMQLYAVSSRPSLGGWKTTTCQHGQWWTTDKLIKMHFQLQGQINHSLFHILTLGPYYLWNLVLSARQSRWERSPGWFIGWQGGMVAGNIPSSGFSAPIKIKCEIKCHILNTSQYIFQFCSLRPVWKCYLYNVL